MIGNPAAHLPSGAWAGTTCLLGVPKRPHGILVEPPSGVLIIQARNNKKGTQRVPFYFNGAA